MDAINEILHRFGKIIVKQLKDDIVNRPATKFGPANASGKLADSIRYEVDKDGLKIFAKGYAEFVDRGRKPGKKPPVKPIEEWVGIKLGIVEEKKRKSIAYAIQMKIAKEGTEGFKQGGTGVFSDVFSPELVQKIQDELNSTIQGKVVTMVRAIMAGKEPEKLAA